MRFFVGCLTAVLLAIAARAQVPPRDPGAQLNFPLQPGSFGYTFENAFPTLAFTSPIAIVSPPGETNRLFVVEQAGRIRVIPNLANPTLETFLELRTNTVTGGEQGMLGLAFHPGYATNGRFFVFRTVTSTTRGATNRPHQRISEFRVSPGNANRTDNFEKILLQQADDANNHNGGELVFGPDGYLYASLGDEGLLARADHLAVPHLGTLQVLDQGATRHRQRGGIEQVLDLIQHRGEAARAVQVIHQEPTRGLQVHQERHA